MIVPHDLNWCILEVFILPAFNSYEKQLLTEFQQQRFCEHSDTQCEEIVLFGINHWVVYYKNQINSTNVSLIMKQ